MIFGNLRPAAVAVALAFALAGCGTMRGSGAELASVASTATLATPPGIGLKATRGTRNAAGNNIPGPLAYANAEGRFLYIYEKDALGVSTCVGACLETYAPVAPAQSFNGIGEWSVITREPGVQQLAFQDRPLYVSRAEQEGTTYRMCPVPAHGAGGGSAESPVPWCVALFHPAAGLKIPDGFAVRENPNAGGQILVDADGLTLYAFGGDAAHDGQSCIKAPCKKLWRPVEAAALASPVGAFSIVRRSDGSVQWAYKARGLYTYIGDLSEEDAQGVGVDPRWSPVMLATYFTPPGIQIKMSPGFGTIWADARGMTLYAQNRGARGRGPSRPVTQVDCDAACLQVWRPYRADADADPSGYWSIIKAPDGTRQWAYRGQGLFSYSLDTQPGDTKGKYIYSYYKVDPAGKITNIANGRSAVDVTVSWRPAFPY